MNGSVKGKKYYASKQFYRYIRPGAVRIGASSTNSNVSVSTFQHSAQGTHTIILANTSSSSQDVTVGGANLPGTFDIYRTSDTDNCANVGTSTTGTTLTLPGRSIVTLQAGGTPLATGTASARLDTPSGAGLPTTLAESQKIRVYPNPAKNEGVIVDIPKVP